MYWLRLYTEIMWDRKLRRHPPYVRWCWIGLLCMAKESPVQGVLLLSRDVTVTLQDVTDVTNLNVTEVEEAMEIFQKQDMIFKNEQLGAWEIRAWDKRQYLSDTSAERTRRYRERLKEKEKCDGDVTSQKRHGDAPEYRVQSTDTDIKSKPLVQQQSDETPEQAKPKDDYLQKTADAFEKVFWCRYPRKDKKKDALKAFRAIFPRRQSKKTAHARWDNLQLHLDKSLSEFAQRDPQYIPLGASWLRAQDFDSPPEEDLSLTCREIWVPDDE